MKEKNIMIPVSLWNDLLDYFSTDQYHRNPDLEQKIQDGIAEKSEAMLKRYVYKRDVIDARRKETQS